MIIIIHYILTQNQYLLQACCIHIPHKQWIFDDSHSPKCQKFKANEPPVIVQCEVRRYKAAEVISDDVAFIEAPISTMHIAAFFACAAKTSKPVGINIHITKTPPSFRHKL